MIQDDIILRDWQPSDAAALASNLNNPAVTRYLTEPIHHPYTQSHARVFIGMTNYGQHLLAKAIVADGKLAGGISVIPQEGVWQSTGEMKFFLGEAYQGRGIMPVAILKMISHIFSHYNLNRIFCYTIEEDNHSAHVLLKAGFRQEGSLRNAINKNGIVYNSRLFAILREDLCEPITNLT